MLGIDPIVGSNAPLSFLEDLRSYLEYLNICSLSQAHNPLPNAQHYWYTAGELDLGGTFETTWNDFVFDLSAAGIHLTDCPDKLVWNYNNSRDLITASDAYDCIFHSSHRSDSVAVCPPIWHKALPLKISCFIWLIIHNNILTWENL